MYRFQLLNILKKCGCKNIYCNKTNVQLSLLQNYRCMSSNIISENKEAPATLTSKYNTNEIQQPKKTNVETEQEFLVKLRNDPDVFGKPEEPEIEDEGDIKEEQFLSEKPARGRKLSTKQYADIIKSFIQQRKIKEAIDVLEIRMIKEDRVKPENYIYNLILGACGRVGYTKKAFMLYNDMKKRALKVTGGTYTALFNACANSPWIEDGLTRAKHLKQIMIEKGYEPNETNYNAMIKAFGRCGDLTTAFNIADEMIAKRINIKDDTINFLLQGCISDKNAGFRHALLLWRKIVDKRIQPTLYTYNLMLRCIRDCNIGDAEVMEEVLNKLLGNEVLQLSEQKVIASNECTNDVKVYNDVNTIDKNLRPNLMAKKPHLGNIISLSEVKEPADRLLLVGGFNGFLQNMQEYNCSPDIKTFTQLLDVIPSTEAAEKELLLTMKKLSVTPDIDFYNMLIKKRALRFDYESGRDVLQMIKKSRMLPNLITYGVLALGCKVKEEALELLEEMKQHNYRINVEILGAMLHQACYHYNISYVLEVMDISLKENIEITDKFRNRLELFKKQCKNKVKAEENKSFEKDFIAFRMRHRTWLKEAKFDENQNVHPWQQYRQTTEGDVKYKPKDVRFEPKRTSKFRVKTSLKHVGT